MKFRHLPYLQEKSFEDLWRYNEAKLQALPVPVDEMTAQKVVRLDPTTIAEDNGKINKIGNYAEWLLMKIFAKLPEDAQDKMLDEDGEHVNKVLRTFDRNRSRIENRDINSYKTFEALETVVTPFEGNLTRADKKAEIRKDIEVIDEDDEWIIKSPKTKEAAIILGKGTQWCTAAETSNNFFDKYTKEDHPGSHLYVFINKKDPELKYQLHLQTGQFKNVRNQDASWSRSGMNDSLFDTCFNLEDVKVEPTDVTDSVYYALEDAFEDAANKIDRHTYRLTNEGEPCLELINGRYNQFETTVSFDELIKNPDKYFGGGIKYHTFVPSVIEKIKKVFIEVMKKRFEELQEFSRDNSEGSGYCSFDDPKVDVEDEGKLIIKFHGEYEPYIDSGYEPDTTLSMINFDEDADHVTFRFKGRNDKSITKFMSDESMEEFKEAIAKINPTEKQLGKYAWKEMISDKEQLSFFHPEVKRELKAQQMKFKDALKAKKK
jgi:hypothetical protein